MQGLHLESLAVQIALQSDAVRSRGARAADAPCQRAGWVHPHASFRNDQGATLLRPGPHRADPRNGPGGGAGTMAPSTERKEKRASPLPPTITPRLQEPAAKRRRQSRQPAAEVRAAGPPPVAAPAGAAVEIDWREGW